MVRDIKTQLLNSVHSYGCGQTHQGMPKVIPSTESAVPGIKITAGCRQKPTEEIG